jgi:hypothetical protein
MQVAFSDSSCIPILTKGHPLEIYPTIGTIAIDTPILAFDKLDGSNIRAEWTRKNGFNKFGTRKRLLDASEPVLGEAIPLFMETYDDELNRIFRKERMEKATVFFEFVGENSFAGYHEKEEHTVNLFDIHRYKQGFLTAREFLKLTNNRVPIIPVLYEGKANDAFIRSVKDSTLPGMTFEGVICKGGLDNRRRPISFKIKSQAWLDRLKDKCGTDEKLFQQLK